MHFNRQQPPPIATHALIAESRAAGAQIVKHTEALLIGNGSRMSQLMPWATSRKPNQEARRAQ